MKRHILTWGWAWALVSVIARPVLADGVVRDGIGATSVGRGGTNIANSDTGSILLDNPSGMVNLDGCGLFEFSLDGLITDLDYFDPQNNDNAHNNPVALPTLSYIRKSCDGQWAYGLGLFAPAGFGARWTMNGPPPFFPGEQTYFSLGALGKILPGVAYRLTDQLSVGATFGVAVSHVELEGPFFLQDPSPSPPLAPGVPTHFDLQATGAAPTWSVGLQYQLSEATRLGLSYVDETRFRFDGSLRASVPAGVPGFGGESSSFDADVDLVWPRSLGLGIAHDLCNCHRVSLDVLWFDWSHAFDRIDIKLSDASNPGFAALGTIRDRFPLDWEDSISVRVGYEWFVTECDTLRFGYVYNSGNVPSSTLTPYIPAILEHAFSVGYGKRWGNWSCDAAYQFSFSPERHVGASDIAGGDFDSSEDKAQAHWLLLSVQYRW